MKFNDIFEPIFRMWPECIPLHDAGPVTPCDQGHPDCNPGQVFPALGEEWNRIEREVGYEDGWRDLMVWTLFQVFASESMQLVAAGAMELQTRSVPPEVVERRYFENLHGEGWEDMLAEYER